MAAPNPDPRAARPRRLPRVLAAAACAWLFVRAPFLVAGACGRQPEALQQARDAVTKSRGELLEAAIGLSPAMERLLRERLDESGRLLVYCPYSGTEFEYLARTQFERLRNLLYPRPRDAHFALDARALAARIEARFEHKLIVVDGTQEDVRLPVPGEFELLADQRLGKATRVRYWLLRRAGP